MLNSLNELFELNLTSAHLKNYAAQLWSDCAFFIENKPAYVFGKGHELEPLHFTLQGYYLVLINTGAHSNTALAYKHAQRREKMELTNNLKHLVNQPIQTWQQNLVNDFEVSVFQSIPDLAKIKTWLYDNGAFYASMSGSGASMFGLFKQKPTLKGQWSKHIVYEGIL
jgi:4-diphosphocytidyl-2-C-methyl-D-erythritol kinase